MNVSVNELIAEKAASWYARTCAADFSDADRLRLERWLQESIAHQRAYQQVVNTAERVTRQASVDPRLRALADAALNGGEITSSEARLTSRQVSNGIRQNWRVAAALLIVVGLGVFAMQVDRTQELNTAYGSIAQFANDGMHQQRIVLDDGSIVNLDVGSQLEVSINKQGRHVTLTEGRAYFEVAHDKTRPFLVVANGTRTVALGTQFEVALKPQGVNITLVEGSVEVSATASQWRELMQPGQQLQIQDAGNQPMLHTVNVAAITSWSKDRLVFDGTPLALALEDFNRYASTKVSLGDPTLASIPIGGNVIAGADSDEFVAAITAILPLRSVRTGANEIVLFQRHSPN
jgi:transmembrane sensor